MVKKLVGKVTHYFPKAGVAVVELSAGLAVGDKIEIEKGGEIVKQDVKSMQIEHESLQKAKKGMEIGLKVDEDVKSGAQVYLV